MLAAAQGQTNLAAVQPPHGPQLPLSILPVQTMPNPLPELGVEQSKSGPTRTLPRECPESGAFSPWQAGGRHGEL